MHPGVGDDVDDVGVANHTVNAHLNARVDRAHEHVDLVALDHALGVFHAFGRVGFVVELEPFDFTAGEFAALLVDGHAKRVVNADAELGKGAGVGQHETNADLVALGTGDFWQQEPRGCSADHGCGLLQKLTT